MKRILTPIRFASRLSGQALTPFAPTAGNDGTALLGLHAGTKPMILLSAAIVGLKRTLHGI
jgi:hypothetical protein